MLVSSIAFDAHPPYCPAVIVDSPLARVSGLLHLVGASLRRRCFAVESRRFRGASCDVVQNGFGDEQPFAALAGSADCHTCDVTG